MSREFIFRIEETGLADEERNVCFQGRCTGEEIVRCKDCRYWIIPFDRNDKGEKFAKCKMFSRHYAFNENWYCAGGKRKADIGGKL